MKIKAEHFNHIKAALVPMAHDIAAKRRFLVSEGKAKDVDKRLRWDMMYDANLTKWVCDNLYSYMDDSHIDTALRSIVKELESGTKQDLFLSTFDLNGNSGRFEDWQYIQTKDSGYSLFHRGVCVASMLKSVADCETFVKENS